MTDETPFVPMVTCNENFDMSDACGGDLIGTWTIGEMCGNDIPSEAAALLELCSTATFSTFSYDVTGTVVADATTFTQDISGTVSVDTNIPAACLVLGPFQLDCAGAQAAANEQEGITATCVDGADGSCDCVVSADLVISTSGELTTGNNIATVTSGDDSNDFYYCVDGNQLTFRETEISNPDARPIVSVGKPE